MGAECSNCSCTNRDDEKILIIENSDKLSKFDNVRRGRLNNSDTNGDAIKNFKINSKQKLQEILNSNPKLNASLIKIQSLIKKYKYRKLYKAILKKHRVIFYYIFFIFYQFNQGYFCQEELFETLGDNILKTMEQSEGSYTYNSEAIYSGSWLGGFRHGRGLMKWKDGTYYEGEWNLGYAEGRGMLVYSNGDYMRGNFFYNKLNGYGECYNNELCYEYKGFWENDLQCGEGKQLPLTLI